MHDNVAKTQFQWHSILPSSSHWGGLWKAGIEPLKYLWERIVGEALLTFDKFNTDDTNRSVLEYLLMVVSSDSNVPTYLRTGHFLIGCPLTFLPEPYFTIITMNNSCR